MTSHSPFPLIAVDVGNCRIKLGHFDEGATEPLPRPDRSVALPLDASDKQLIGWLPGAPAPGDYMWAISSVNRPAATRIVESLKRMGVQRTCVLTRGDVPMAVDLPQPDQVGLDRLVNALAARAICPGVPVIVVSIGTAITVNLVSADGAFLGGAILPGLDMSARALHEFTDLLPLVEVAQTDTRIGRSTNEAMQLGLYWGAIGAVREVIGRLAPDASVEVVLTGGGAESLVPNLSDGKRSFQWVPHLTLSGIALAMLGPRTTSTS
jgi:type III pantothenate kinase